MANFNPSSTIEIDSLQAWTKAIQEARGLQICGLGIETAGQDPLTSRIRLAELALSDGRVYVADIFDLGSEAIDDLASFLEDGGALKVLHDAGFLLSFMRASERRRLKPKNIFDTMLASQVCWSGFYEYSPSNSPKNPWKKRMPDHSLDALAERHLGVSLSKSIPPTDWSAEDLRCEEIDSAAMRVRVLLPIHTILEDLLVKNGQQTIADLEFRTISPVVEMELAGVYMNPDATADLIRKREWQLFRAVMDLQAEAKRGGFNLLPEGGKSSGNYINPERREDVLRYLRSQGYYLTSIRSEILRELAISGVTFAEKLYLYRRISHQLAFLNDWLRQIHPSDGRIHPKYLQLQSATGRLTSKKPNAQQVPRRGEDCIAIRRLFKAPRGKKLVKADFSTIELRIMACLSGDETMQRAFQEGLDLHKLTASRIGGIPPEQVTHGQRQAAKSINYLLIYGGSAATLQERAYYDYDLMISRKDADEARDKYFETYQGVTEWQKNQVREMSYTHKHYFHDCVGGTYYLPLTCTFTALGRRRVWPRFGAGLKATKFQVFNTPCQGTGADLIKLVMCEIYERLTSEDARLICSIHDEIMLEIPDDQAEYYAKMLEEIMNRIGSELLYPVPVTSEVTILSSWGG